MLALLASFLAALYRMRMVTPGTILLDDSLQPQGASYLFEEPVEVLCCERLEEVVPVLQRLDAARREGLYAAGFLSYELGYLFEPRLIELLPRERDQPLLWMGLYRDRRTLDAAATEAWIARNATGPHRLEDRGLSISRAEYLEAFGRVRDYILAGDVYQTNLTLRRRFAFQGDPLSLYRELRRRQAVAYGGFVATGDLTVLSFSPELFLRITEGKILTRPMKGTARRGATPEEDAAIARELALDEKNRAENLMIVDLLRNDLGRVCEIGSVKVSDLFTVETYQTLHQMTSGIEARLREGVDLSTLLYGLFPCGSITGAPKIRAMEILRELETGPRGIYTGSLGMIAPDGESCFNVAIRTLALHADGRGEMGIGSGVVYDSDGAAEFEECLLKAKFLGIAGDRDMAEAHRNPA